MRAMCFHVHGYMGKNNASVKYFSCQDDQKEVRGGGGVPLSYLLFAVHIRLIIARNVS